MRSSLSGPVWFSSYIIYMHYGLLRRPKFKYKDHSVSFVGVENANLFSNALGNFTLYSAAL